MKLLFTILLLFIGPFGIQSQHLTISSSGQTGTSGTNWSISGTNPVIITATGTANVNTSVIMGYLNSGTSVIVENLTSNGSVALVSSSAIVKNAGGDATLTFKAAYQAVVSSSITSSSSKLNIVLWSDFNNNNLAGVAITSTINTNGGHFWAGGSSSAAGSYTWNGLTVGNGPSVGSNSGNNYGMDFFSSSIATGGGDILLWAGVGNISTHDGMGLQNNPHLNAGSGNVTLITRQIFNAGNTVSITSTGKLTLTTDANNPWASAFNWSTTTAGSNATLTSALGQPLQINNFSSLGGLSIGVYDGFGSSFSFTNNQNININSSINIPGPINFYGGLISLGVGVEVITSTANGSMNFQGKSGFSTAANSGNTRGKLMTTGGGDITISADSDNNNSGTLDIDWLTIDGNIGDVLLEAAAFNWNTGSQVTLPEFYGTGALTIRTVPSATYAFNTAWIALFNTKSELNLGRAGNNDVVEINPCTVCHQSAINASGNTILVAGPININARSTNINLNLTASVVNADILVKANDFIIVHENKAIRTNNGDITLWSNANGIANTTEGDFIGFYSGVSINSANGAINQLNGGGAITIAGGTTSQTLPSGTVVPTDYAYSNRTTNWGPLLPPGGVNFGFSTAANGQVNSLSIYSGGGNIVIKGKSNSSSAGVQWFSGSTGAVQVIHSGSGTVNIDGSSTSSTAHGIEFNSYASVVFPTITSLDTTSAAINIKGETSSNNTRAGYQGSVNLIANGIGGGIEINGKVASASNYSAIEASGINAYALSGPITFIGDGGLGLRIGGNWGRGNLTSSSSNILLRANVFSLYNSNIVSTGTVTVEPIGSSFSSAVIFPPTVLSIPNTITGLTIGKSSNTANITLSRTTSVAGPVTIFGGDIAVNQNITSTLNGAAILLQGTGAINLASNRTIQSNAGNITFRSNSGGTALTNASSIILNSGSSLLSQGGNITLGGNFTGAQGTGLYATSNNASAILIDGGTISAAGGNIKLYGKCNASYADGILMRGTINTIDTGNIELYGEAHGGNNGTDYFGGITFGSAAGSTIETENGNIILNGLLTNTQNNNTGAINFYRNGGSTGQTRHINLLSKKGTITINADRGTTGAYGIGHSSWGDVFVGSPSSGSWTATGAIVFNYSSLVNAGFNGIKVKTSGAVTYQPITSSFAAAQTFPVTANYILAEGASSLTIGKTGNTANITIGSAQTVAGPFNIFGGTVALNGAINVGSNNLSIEANTALTQTAAITTNGLALSGAGTMTLNNTSNNITTLAGGSTSSRLGSLSLTDASGGLTIGTVGSRSGIHTNSGVVLVETLNGNIDLNKSVTTNNTTTNAIIINAGKNASIGVSAGGNILVNGNPTISTGTGGISKLFSGLESNSVGLTSLVGGSTNTRFNFDETTTTFTPALNTNTAYAIYRTSLGIGDLTIVNSGGDAINSTWIYDNGVISTITNPVNINASVLANYLSSDTLIIEAGNVTINGAITSSANNPFVINSNGIKTIAVNASISLGGSATFNSNDFSLNNAINIATSSASDITINTNANFGTFGTTRKTMSSAGGNIIIHADKDANGSGVLDLDYLTFNPGVGNIIIRGETAAFSIGSTERPYINGTGSFTFEPSDVAFGQDMQTTWFGIDQDNNGISGITIGKIGNTANIIQNSHLTIAGPVNYYGGNITVSSNLTSSANGDVLFKGILNNNPSIAIQSGVTVNKSSGTGTLTMQGHSRVTNLGSITASGSAVLNVIMWSDFDNSNNDGGVSQMGTISTNGGHVWLGGSNSNGGSYTWNGLTVGDGPAIGSSGFNANALDLFNNVTTNGGDFFAWAGNGAGSGTSGIASNGTIVINTGSGDITFVASSTSGTIQLNSTGLISLLPNAGSYASALTLGGTLTSGHFTINTSFYNGLRIDNVSSLGGLTIGRYTEFLNNGDTVNLGNTSNITVSSAFSLGGSFSLFGGAIALNANITTTNSTTGNININGTSISGTGNLVLASGRTATLNSSTNSTYDGIISGTGSGLTKLGTGFLTLTKDHTYSGATAISTGDLQVGTGGSVSQASSGTISNTSGVTVASGSKLILSPNENMVFTAPISGAGGVEIKGASGNYYNVFLTGTAATIATNSSVLEVLTRITGGLMDGQQVLGGGTQGTGAYVKSYNAATNSASLQFQQFDGVYTKVVFAVLSQSGTNVQIRANTSIYNGAAYRNNNHLGADMATGSILMGLATSSAGTGYGIAQVYLSGKVNFTGALSYTGNTILSNSVTSVTSPNTYSYISKGTQEITDASSSFPATSTVINNGLVIFNRATPLTISSNMEGTEDVLQVGAPITLTGTCTHSGITTIDLNKSLTIGNGSTLGSITGDIVNHGTLTFSRSNNSSYPGIITGSGSLVKSGAGTHTLSGWNTYSGSTTINAGQLVIERDIPVTSSTGFSGAGELVIQPSSTSFTNALNYPLSGFNVSSTIGGLTIGKLGNTANLTVTNNTLANGPITFYSGTITLNADVISSNSGNISFFSDDAMNIASQRNVNAAGTFSYIPQNNSFASTVTYPITNLKVNCKGLWIGKTTNSSSVIFADTTIIDGPITAFGGSLSINENMRSSNGSNISLYGNSITIGANKTLSSSGRLILAPQSVSNTIGIAGATGTLQLPSSYFTTNFADGFSYIQVGTNSQTGNISSNGLTLRDSINFMTSGSLSLGGKIVLGANHVILDSSIANVIVGSPANYFQTNGSGVIKSILGTNKSRLFPIGNAYYNPVTITNKSDTLDEFSTRLIDSVSLNGNSGNLITNPHVKATWDIFKTRANSGSGIDFEFSWDTAQERGGINNFILNHHNGSGWEIAAGNTGTVSGTTTKTITHTGYTGSFSPFAFGSSLTALPVELVAFNAKCMNDFIQIKWTTASEKNNKMFELYKSENASDWEWIHTESGQGDKASETNYQFVDYKKQAAYYRLKDIDFDGNVNWSPIIFADCKNEVGDVKVYPNPASDFIKVITEIDNNTTLRILSLDGRILKSLNLVSKQTLVSLKDLVNGVYFIEINGKTASKTIKIVKE